MLPHAPADWLRLALTALAVYLATLEALYLFGYVIPTPGTLSLAHMFLYPYALLAIGAIAALFVRRRLGVAFLAVAVLLLIAAALIPAQ